jgi:hypothetical protein
MELDKLWFAACNNGASDRFAIGVDMVKPEITVTEGGDFDSVRKGIAHLSRMRAYVGVPEKNASRPGEPVNNAELMYIHTNGSPLRNIPPRPVIEPAIEASDNRSMIEDELAECADAELDGKIDEAINHLVRAGTIGSNAAKRWFRDPRNGWPENAPSTIAKKGSDRPLIDTGELRRSITHVEEY